MNSPATHHHHIVEVELEDGTRKAREAVADDIDKGRESYIVVVDKVTIGVATETVNGVKYIRTRPDSTTKDNLLNLPRY